MHITTSKLEHYPKLSTVTSISLILIELCGQIVCKLSWQNTWLLSLIHIFVRWKLQFKQTKYICSPRTAIKFSMLPSVEKVCPPLMYTMYTTKQAVPVECLDWWLFPLIHSLGQQPHFCLNGWSANPVTPKMVEPYLQSWTWQHLIEFPSNRTSISLTFEDIRMWQTDNADHYHRWPPHCGGPAIKQNPINTTSIGNNWTLRLRFCQLTFADFMSKVTYAAMICSTMSLRLVGCDV